MITRRETILTGVAAGAGALLSGFPAIARGLQTIRVGIGLKSVSAAVMPLAIPEQLGYAKKAGFRIRLTALGSATNVLVALDKGDRDFGVVAPSFNLPLAAKGELPPIIAFYEYTYPYKWDIVVKPDSPIRSYADLRGKKVGVSTFGTTDYPVTRAVLKNIGINPSKDVTWQAVGEGVTAGIALERGVVDALAYFDVGFGIIENAGIKLRFLPRPAKLPMIGGNYIAAMHDYIAKNRELCIAYGRSVAMASLFILTNPRAGASAFLAMFPETARRGLSHERAVAMTVNLIKRRMTLYRSPYHDTKFGVIHGSEWREEASFMGLRIKNVAPLYTNDMIDAINDFDHDAVIAEAKSYKV